MYEDSPFKTFPLFCLEIKPIWSPKLYIIAEGGGFDERRTRKALTMFPCKPFVIVHTVCVFPK